MITHNIKANFLEYLCNSRELKTFVKWCSVERLTVIKHCIQMIEIVQLIVTDLLFVWTFGSRRCNNLPHFQMFSHFSETIRTQWRVCCWRGKNCSLVITFLQRTSNKWRLNWPNSNGVSYQRSYSIHRTRLVLRWAIVRGYTVLVYNQPFRPVTQPPTLSEMGNE